MKAIKTLIVDDDDRVRRYISRSLTPEPDIEVIGEAADGRDAIYKTRDLKPDLVLMDLRMPVMNGIEATRLLKNEMPALKVIILTIYDQDEYREAAIDAGANGYILKKSINEDLISAIQRLLE